MNKQNFIVSIVLVFISLSTQSVLAASALEQAYAEYRGTENLSFSADRGKEIWNKDGITKAGKIRNCRTCHGEDLSKNGKHAKTGKTIDPLAPSANKERFTELKKINKWFKRNCKWTFGRECTSQEKGDILEYLTKL
jgi:cytochrome c553